jgi:small conductance mechanosensitive channel
LPSALGKCLLKPEAQSLSRHHFKSHLRQLCYLSRTIFPEENQELMISKSRILSLFFITLLVISGVYAQATFAEEGKNPTAASSETATQASAPFEKLFNKIEEQSKTIEWLKKRRNSSEGLPKQVFEKRLTENTLEWLAQGNKFATEVAAQQKDDPDLSRHREQAREILKEQLSVVHSTINQLRSQIKMPASAELTATQRASAYIGLLDTQDAVNQAYALLVENIELSQKFETDTSQMEDSLQESIQDVAVTRSVLLEIEMQNVKALRESVAISPDDKELKHKLTISAKHLKQLAEKFTPLLTIMNSLAIDTTAYREQVVKATGTISRDVVEIDVIKDLLIGWGEKLRAVLIEDGPDLIFKLCLFLIILYIANKISKVLKKIVETGLERSSLQLSELLRRMVVSLVRNLILIIGFLIALSQMGISLGPLLAGFGIIGFVIGFALQDSLSNFAAGLMILVYRPYDVGDLIESGGMTGRVSHMSLVNTTIITFDNQTIVVPNNKIWGDVIKNITAQTTRRVDMVFGISYGDDISKAERVLQKILETHDKVLAEPEPIVRLHELGDSSVNFIVRPWVKKEDYWDVYWDITRTVKITFDEEGLSIPFPQRDIHLYQKTLPDSQ